MQLLDGVNCCRHRRRKGFAPMFPVEEQSLGLPGSVKAKNCEALLQQRELRCQELLLASVHTMDNRDERFWLAIGYVQIGVQQYVFEGDFNSPVALGEYESFSVNVEVAALRIQSLAVLRYRQGAPLSQIADIGK